MNQLIHTSLFTLHALFLDFQLSPLVGYLNYILTSAQYNAGLSQLVNTRRRHHRLATLMNTMTAGRRPLTPQHLHNTFSFTVDSGIY